MVGFGPNCVEFEKEFAAWNGNRYAITTNSGTAALHMAIAACGCSEGDEILVTAYSWSSSATCILHHNCIPVFVDIDFDTINIDVDKIEAAITPKTKAIIVVHLHGLAVNMDKVMALAARHNLKVIEDACDHMARSSTAKRWGRWATAAPLALIRTKISVRAKAACLSLMMKICCKKTGACSGPLAKRAPQPKRATIMPMPWAGCTATMI